MLLPHSDRACYLSLQPPKKHRASFVFILKIPPLTHTLLLVLTFFLLFWFEFLYLQQMKSTPVHQLFFGLCLGFYTRFRLIYFKSKKILLKIFFELHLLAVMSSSRSDSVIHFIRPFVCLPFLLYVLDKKICI